MDCLGEVVVSGFVGLTRASCFSSSLLLLLILFFLFPRSFCFFRGRVCRRRYWVESLVWLEVGGDATLLPAFYLALSSHT